jgi:hypothetical protein
MRTDPNAFCMEKIIGDDSGIWDFTVVAIKSHILCDVMPYSPVKVVFSSAVKKLKS